jgi:anti-anti-sigma factor
MTYELKTIPGIRGVLCLELKGFLYAGTLAKLAECFHTIPASTARLLLDFSGVQYVSAGAWNHILELQHRINSNGGKMVLYGLKPEVQDGFEFMELHQTLKSFPGRKEALAGGLSLNH